MSTAFAHGKICYLELPAADIKQSARFYRDVFRWSLRSRGDGEVTFDDGIRGVSGTWRTDLSPAATPGIVVHLMVDDLDAAIAAITAAGGSIVGEIHRAAEKYARFADPAGNVLGIYEQKPG